MKTLALTLALALAAPLAAQTQLADSAGTFVGLDQLSFGTQNFLALDATVGHRYQSGLDIGLRVAGARASGYGRSVRFQIAPTVGYTQAVGMGALGRVEATAEYASSNQSFNLFAETPSGGISASKVDTGQRAARVEVAASVSRPVALLGSVRVHPTVGGYATAVRAFDVRRPADFSGTTNLELHPTGLGAGVEVGLPVSFRLFGLDAAVVPSVRMELIGDALRVQRLAGAADPSVRLGFRLNF